MTAWRTQAKSKEAKIILIVSQNSKTANAWTLAFKQKGYYVIHEKTPRHALQAARLTLPALVIVDLDIPQSERLSLCDELRSMTSHAIFVLDPMTAESDISNFNLAGADKRFSSAINPSALFGISPALMTN